MRIAVIGAGSTYTPELVEGFARRAHVLGLRELVLYDIDAERLDVVGGLARRILARSGFPGTVITTTDLDGAVTGAAGIGFASAFTGFERRGAVAPAADFGELDRLLAVAGVGADAGASGQVIAQLLGHTS